MSLWLINFQEHDGAFKDILIENYHWTMQYDVEIHKIALTAHVIIAYWYALPHLEVC